MTANKAELLLLKIGDGASPAESFITLGGLRSTRMTVNRNPVTATDVLSEGWRRVLDEAGNAAVRVQGSGLFLNSAAEAVLRGQTMAGTVTNYQLHFGNGDCLSGAFVVSQYERSGKVGDMEAFSLTLESAGAMSYMTA